MIANYAEFSALQQMAGPLVDGGWMVVILLDLHFATSTLVARQTVRDQRTTERRLLCNYLCIVKCRNANSLKHVTMGLIRGGGGGGLKFKPSLRQCSMDLSY